MTSENIETEPPNLINVLLVDDNDMDNEFHKIVIEDTCLAKSVAVAFNGQEAVEALTATAGTSQEPNLILLDINMPVMDGFEFLDAFKEMRTALSLQSIVIVMLTTSLMDEHRYRTENIPGLKGYMNKPLTEDSFKILVAVHFSNPVSVSDTQ